MLEEVVGAAVVEADGAVGGGGGDDGTEGVEGAGEEGSRGGEGVEELMGRHIPQAEGPVIRRRHHQPLIG